MQTLKAGLLYFVVVFGAVFALGSIRILWVVPRIGMRMAEPLEAPIMFVVMIVAAQWLVRRLGPPPTISKRLGMGAIGLGLMLVAEFTVWFACEACPSENTLQAETSWPIAKRLILCAASRRLRAPAIAL